MNKKVFIDRRKSGNIDFSEDFPVLQEGELECSNNSIRIHMFLDIKKK